MSPYNYYWRCVDCVYWGKHNQFCPVCEAMNLKEEDKYQRPILTVDVCCFTLINDELYVLLATRDKTPHKGLLSLPGGYVHVDIDEDSLDSARRVAKEKLGIDVPYLEQLRTFSGNKRDPRGWSASICYIAFVQPSVVKEKGDFYQADLVSKDTGYSLAFDHQQMLDEALKRIRDKSSYSSLPLFLMDDKFTLNDLQIVYQSIMKTDIDKATFRRKILDQEIVEPTGEILKNKIHRPAKLYKPSEKTLKIFKSIVSNRE